MTDDPNRGPVPNPARVDERPVGRHERELRYKKALDERLERGLEETFPGSDAVAVTQPPHSPYDRNGR
jgi:hypothetical protein